MKAEQFKNNYAKELKVPTDHLEDIQFKGGALDGEKYFNLKYYLHADQMNTSMKTKLAELGRHHIRGKRVRAKETETEQNRAKYFSQIDRARLQDIDRSQAGTQLEWDEQFCLGEIF